MDKGEYAKNMEDYLNNLKKIDKEEAKEIAFNNLVKSKILNEDGEFTDRYKYSKEILQKKSEEHILLYEYQLTDCQIKKNEYQVKIKQRNNGVTYIIKKNDSYKHVFDFNLDKNRLNTIYSLTDDFNKYSKIILDAYRRKNEKMRKELEEREKVLERVLENMGKMG